MSNVPRDYFHKSVFILCMYLEHPELFLSKGKRLLAFKKKAKKKVLFKNAQVPAITIERRLLEFHYGKII